MFPCLDMSTLLYGAELYVVHRDWGKWKLHIVSFSDAYSVYFGKTK